MTTKIPAELSSTPGIADSSNATAITITSDENVLIGSSTSIASNIGLQITGTDAAGFMSLFRDDSSVVANDDLGGILFYGDDNNATTQFAYIRATAEGTHADGDNPTAIRFGTTADGSETVTERMRIDSSGGVQIGASSIANLKFSQSSDVISITAKKDGTDAIPLTFHTQASGGTTGERMRINSSGNVGIGNTNPTERLHVQAASINSDVARITGANADRGLLIKTDAVGATNDVFVIFDVDHSAGHIGFQTNSVEAMRITNGSYVGIGDTSPAYRLELPNTASAAGQGRANNWIVYSDSRIKSNIQVLNYGLDIVKQLKPSKYKHHNSIKNDDGQFVKLDEGANDIGFIAQEVLPLMPEVVAIPEDTDKDLYSLNYPKLTAVLTKAIQEQQDIIDDLKSRIETLEG